MLCHSRILAAGLIFGVTAAAIGAHAAEKVPAYITQAVADSGRPAADKEHDAKRKPAEVVAFAGVKKGDQIADFFPGGGYFTRIFSKIVGPRGHVYGIFPGGFPEKMLVAEKAIAADPAYSNVSEQEQPLAPAEAGEKMAIGFQTPQLDLFWTSQNYHDVHNIKNIDMLAFNKGVFDALKPGGIYIVLDHTATPGSGGADTATLHRIDPETVKKEVEAAGFVLVKESDLLKNPNDPHTAKVFDPAIRGSTDQFILKFQKPKNS
jgi:predicted methyltransferase